MAEPQEQSLHLQSPPEMFYTWLSHNSKMSFRLPGCAYTKPPTRVRRLCSIRALQHGTTPAFMGSVVITYSQCRIFLILFYVCGCFASMHFCAPCACCVHGGRKKAWDPLGAENLTRILGKSGRCS